MIELPGVIEDGMSRRNSQRKPGTTRGSLRRSRTAKASRISRQAAKSRCAREWGGWGRLSDDDPRQNNSGPSEDPWGGGLPSLHGGASTPNRPDAVRDIREYGEMHERRQQTNPWPVYAGSRLKLSDALGRHRRKCQPSSRTGENPPYGMIGGSRRRRHHAKPGPRLDPTQLRGAAGNSRPYRECRHGETIATLGQPASEKRQGTKSREVGHRRCRGRLWRFSRGTLI
jgi:hypothetical protein